MGRSPGYRRSDAGHRTTPHRPSVSNPGAPPGILRVDIDARLMSNRGLDLRGAVAHLVPLAPHGIGPFNTGSWMMKSLLRLWPALSLILGASAVLLLTDRERPRGGAGSAGTGLGSPGRTRAV